MSSQNIEQLYWFLCSEWQDLSMCLIQDLWYLVFQYHDFTEKPECSCCPKPELYSVLLEVDCLPGQIWNQVFEFCDFDWIDQTERVSLDPWKGQSSAEYTCRRFGHRIRLEVRGVQFYPLPLLNPPQIDPQVFGPHLPGWDQSRPVEPIHMDGLYCWKIICCHDLLHPRLDAIMTELGFRVRHSPHCFLVDQGPQPNYQCQVLYR